MAILPKRMLLLTAAVAVAALPAAAQTVNASVSFDEKIHDFGAISETGGKVSHRFYFTNVGADTVSLVRAQAGCNCVSARVGARPVAPGGRGYVDVSYDPDYRPGHFSKEIVVISTGNRYNRIWVRGDVEPGVHPIPELYRYAYGEGLYMNYRVMNFGRVAPGEPLTMDLGLGNASTQTLHLAFVLSIPAQQAPQVGAAASSPQQANPFAAADVAVDVAERYVLRPGEQGVVPVTVSVRMPLDAPRRYLLTPYANGFPLQPLEITVLPTHSPRSLR